MIRVCEHCWGPMYGKRHHATTCSTTCRVAEWRIAQETEFAGKAAAGSWLRHTLDRLERNRTRKRRKHDATASKVGGR